MLSEGRIAPKNEVGQEVGFTKLTFICIYKEFLIGEFQNKK